MPSQREPEYTLDDFSSPRHAVDLSELSSYYAGRSRPIFTTVTREAILEEDTSYNSYDFLTLISVACDVYNANKSDLIVMQSFQHGAEQFENSGMNCVVSRKAVTMSTPSNITRGQTEHHEQNIVVKRTHEGVVAPGSRALKSFIAELRVRAHAPLRIHTNIVDLCGIAWDFEDEERLKPRPSLLEEYASEGSLSHFWMTKNLTRMPFKTKCALALDIANGLSALHACGVVHGDVKPDNVLVFPKQYPEAGYAAKLTDFGHSVFEFEGRDDLRAFTLPYSAPEATHRPLTFSEMTKTDVYSYGLVLLSLFLGRNSCQDFGDQLQSHKINDTLYVKAFKIIEQEDRKQTDSDFNLPTLRKLLMFTVRLSPQLRNLTKCIQYLRR